MNRETAQVTTVAPRTLAIVPTWTDLDLTRRAVASLLAQEGAACDVVVVDNGSSDDHAGTLAHEFPPIRTIRNATNLGAAAARNAALRIALAEGYDFVLFLDNDARAAPDMLAVLLDALRRNPKAGIVGPKIYRDDRPDIIWRAGCTSWKWTYLHAGPAILDRLWDAAGLSPRAFLDAARGMDQPDRGQFDRERNIAFQISCAMLTRIEVFREVGLLDEDFTPYGSEDIDFSARVVRAGWKIRYVPTARCWHRVGSSFREEYARTYYNARHIILLARKNVGAAYFWLAFMPDFLLLTVPLKILAGTADARPKKLRALADAIRWNVVDARRRGVHLRR